LTKINPTDIAYFFECTKNAAVVSILSLRENHPLKETFLFDDEKEKLSNLKNEKRRLEFCAIRFIRNQKNIPFSIAYSPIGAPYLAGSPMHVGISHSNDLVGLALAPFKIGLDIELISDRILTIKNRFTTSQEVALFSYTEAMNFTIIWTIKEVLYKLAGRLEINLISELMINSVEGDTANCLFLSAEGWRSVAVKFQEKNDYIISFNPSTYHEK
jgi:phosphopantetheinyl transferase